MQFWSILSICTDPYYTIYMSSHTLNLDRAIERAAVQGKRVRVSNGGAKAVIVPEEDAIFLEAVEDYLDIKDVKKRREQPSLSKTISWTKARKKLGM